jgi:hypothetical protein
MTDKGPEVKMIQKGMPGFGTSDVEVIPPREVILPAVEPVLDKKGPIPYESLSEEDKTLADRGDADSAARDAAAARVREAQRLRELAEDRELKYFQR